MSSEQIFTTAPNELPNGMLKHDTHKAVAIMDAEDPAAYRFNHHQGDVIGTLVPVPSPNGGIKGSGNPFGKIVMGTETKLIDGRLQEVPFTPTWLGDAVKKKRGAQPMAPPPPPTERPSAPASAFADDAIPFPDLLGEGTAEEKEAADLAVQEQAMKYKEQARAAVEAQAQAEAELGDILEQMNSPQQAAQSPVQQAAPPQTQGPSAMDMQQFGQMMQMWEQFKEKEAARPSIPEPADTDDDLGYDPSDVPPTRVKLSGSFGTSRGMYKYVHITDDFVILIYEEDSNIFTPPSSQETFKLSCNKEEYDVYFVGVEFELPFYKTGVQVMVRS